MRTFRTERIAPAIWTGRAVLWEWISRRVRIEGVHFDTSSGGDTFNVIEVEVGYVSFEQCNTESELPLYVLGVPASDEGLAVSVFLMTLYACCCTRRAARMF